MFCRFFFIVYFGLFVFLSFFTRNFWNAVGWLNIIVIFFCWFSFLKTKNSNESNWCHLFLLFPIIAFMVEYCFLLDFQSVWCVRCCCDCLANTYFFGMWMNKTLLLWSILKKTFLLKSRYSFFVSIVNGCVLLAHVTLDIEWRKWVIAHFYSAI